MVVINGLKELHAEPHVFKLAWRQPCYLHACGIFHESTNI